MNRGVLGTAEVLTPPISVYGNFSVPYNSGPIFARALTGVTGTLCAASEAATRSIPITIKNLGSIAITIASQGGTIDGSTTVALAQNETIAVLSDGQNWQRV